MTDETKKDILFYDFVRDYIDRLQWGEEVDEGTKGLVASNINGFASFIKDYVALPDKAYEHYQPRGFYNKEK